MDTFSPKMRSFVMSRVKSKNTSLEIRFRKLLFSKGLRYRLHYKIEGSPDVVMPAKKAAIFIDGCFWHKCPRCYKSPEANRQYWEAKVNRNVARDKRVNKKLKAEGWTVIRIWEHEINERPATALRKVTKTLERRKNVNDK